MTLTSPGGSQGRKSKEGSNDESDISNQNLSLRRIRKVRRRLPQKPLIEDDEAAAKSKIKFRASSPKNILSIPQDSEVIHSRVVIPNNHKFSDKMTSMLKTSPPEANLPLQSLQKPDPLAEKYARGLLKLNCSLPLLNKKVFIDDWSAPPHNQSFPILFIELSMINRSFSNIANSTATSAHCENIDLASLSVSTILNDSYNPSISKILQNESFDATSSCVPSTPLIQTIDPTTSSVAVSPHDDNVDPASISVISTPDVKNVDSAPNLVAHTQFNQICGSKTETFDPASNFVALTPYSQSFSPKVVNLDPTFNPVAITPCDQSFQPMFNSSELAAHTLSVDSASFFVESKPHHQSNKSEESFDSAFKPDAHAPLSQNIDPISSCVAVASISIASLLLEPATKKRKAASKSVEKTSQNQSNNSETKNIDAASELVEHIPLNQSSDYKTKNNDLVSKTVEHKPLRQSVSQKNEKIKASSKLAGNILSNRSSNSETKNNDPSSEPVEHIPLNQSVSNKIKNLDLASKSIKHKSLNQCVKLETTKGKIASESAVNTLLNQSNNYETKNVDGASKLVEHIPLNHSNNNETKNNDIVSKSVAHKPLNQVVNQKSLNQSIINDTKVFDSTCKSVEHEPLKERVKLKTKKSKVACKSAGTTPLNQSSNFETKNVDVVSKVIEHIPLNQNNNSESKNIDLISKKIERKPLNQSATQNNKTIKVASKLVKNTPFNQSDNSGTGNIDRSSEAVKQISLNKSVSNGTKNLDSASKLVSYHFFSQSELRTKKDKIASKSTGNTPQNQTISTEPKNVDAIFKLIKQIPLDQSITHKTKNIDVVLNSPEHKALNQSVKQKIKKSKAPSKSGKNTQLSQSSNPERKNVNTSFKSTENTTLNQSTTLDTKNIDLTSKSTGHIPLNQSINPETKNIDQASKLAGHTSLNHSFQPMFNSSALTSNSQSIDSVSISSISCSQSSFNPDAKPFVPSSRSISQVVPSQSFECTSQWVANLPYSDCDDTASIPAMSISHSETKPTYSSVTRKSKRVVLNRHKQGFVPNADPTAPALHSPDDQASHNSNLDSAPNFGNETSELNSNNVAHTRDLASSTTLSIPQDENVELKDHFSEHTPLNYSFDPGCNSTELSELDQVIEVEDNLATHTTHSQSSNSAEPRTYPKQVFDPILNSIALSQYHQNFGYNLNTDLGTNRVTSQNQSFEPTVEFSESISKNQDSNQASGLIALPRQVGSVSHASSSNKHSLKNKNVKHATNYPIPTPQNHVFHSVLDIANESSRNQRFYRASDSVAKIPQNQSFNPVSNSITHTTHNQRFKRASYSIDGSLHSQIVHPVSNTIPHTSNSQSFRPEYNSVTRQNFDSEPGLNKPLSNIQMFFSQFKSVVSLHTQSSNPVPAPADYTVPPPPYKASRFAKLFRQDLHPTSNLSSLIQHSQSSESKPIENELIKKNQKFNSISNIVAPPQQHDFDPVPHPAKNAQQMLSRALGFNEQPYLNEPALAAPRNQGGPLSNFIAMIQQPNFDDVPLPAEKNNSIPHIVAPPNNQHFDPGLKTTQHSPQNKSFHQTDSSNEQASQDASTSGGGSQSRGFDPTTNLPALTQNTENFKSTVNKKSSSATHTSSSSNQNLSNKAVEPQKAQLDLANMPKFVIRVEQSANYEQVSSFNAFSQHNETYNSTFNPVKIPQSQDRDSPVTYLQEIRGVKSVSHLETPTDLFGLIVHTQNIDKAHCFEGQTQEKTNVNTISTQPSENEKNMPPPGHGFNQEPSQEQNLNLKPSFFEHPPPNQKFDSAHDFHQQPPETQNLSPKSSLLKQPPSNQNFNPAHGFHHKPLQSQPRFFRHPPPNQKLNSPHDFHHQSSKTQNFSSKPDSFGEPQINRNFDPARDFNPQPSNNQAHSPYNQNFDSTTIHNKLVPNIQRFFTASNPTAAPCDKNQILYRDSNENNNLHISKEQITELQSLENYLSLSKVGFPKARMSNQDPNSFIDQICKLDDINKHSDSILNLEYGFLETRPCIKLC
ncbi:uncharacterized protein [Choristoneura fumiferana]|uniref:uncharacterized protein n=1 Tax=Choristoneura fumiferana TaxID=7141 RepID=UPI003D15CCA3